MLFNCLMVYASSICHFGTVLMLTLGQLAHPHFCIRHHGSDRDIFSTLALHWFVFSSHCWEMVTWLVVWIPLKNMSSSVGMMTFPIYGKKHVPNHQKHDPIFRNQAVTSSSPAVCHVPAPAHQQLSPFSRVSKFACGLLGWRRHPFPTSCHLRNLWDHTVPRRNPRIPGSGLSWIQLDSASLLVLWFQGQKEECPGCPGPPPPKKGSFF